MSTMANDDPRDPPEETGAGIGVDDLPE